MLKTSSSCNHCLLIPEAFFPGGGYRGRGSPRGAGGQRGHGNDRRQPTARPPKEPLKFDSDYDFESANAQFDKDQIEKELRQKLTISKHY